MNTTRDDFALRGQDFAARAADEAPSDTRNVAQSAPTAAGWLSHKLDRAGLHTEVGLGTHERANPNMLTIIGMIGFFAMMLFVGLFGDRLMW